MNEQTDRCCSKHVDSNVLERGMEKQTQDCKYDCLPKHLENFSL